LNSYGISEVLYCTARDSLWGQVWSGGPCAALLSSKQAGDQRDDRVRVCRCPACCVACSVGPKSATGCGEGRIGCASSTSCTAPGLPVGTDGQLGSHWLAMRTAWSLRVPGSCDRRENASRARLPVCDGRGQGNIGDVSTGSDWHTRSVWSTRFCAYTSLKFPRWRQRS
jgi:hypothetical protein